MATTITFAGQTTGVSVNLNTDKYANMTKILPLGDSLTFGIEADDDSNLSYGYRRFLQDAMTKNGLGAEFVGDQSQGWDRMLDKSNSGVPGRTASQVNTAVPGLINSLHPDVILLLIGTNDIMVNNAGTVVPQRIRTILNTIQATAPGTKVIVAQLPPIPPDTPLGPTATNNIAAVNAALPGMVASAHAAGINVSYVTMPDIRQTLDQQADGVHLTDNGYAKMGADWFNALLASANAAGTFGGTQNTVAADAVNITGSEANDNLVGDGGANIIIGGGGNDQITGGGGADTLTGGTGNDWFVYGSPSDGGDTITDFNTTQDVLAFVDTGFPGLSHLTNVIVTQGTVASGTAAQFIYNQAAGILLWDPDGTGAQAPVVIATLSNKPTLGADDIYVVGREQNDAPTVAASQAAQKAAGGWLFTYTVPATTFADANGDNLIYSALRSNGTALPSWLTFNAATHTFSGTPTAANAGSITVRVTVSDGYGGTTSNNFTLTTRASDAAPVVANPIADRAQTPGTAFSFQFATNVFSDADADTLVYAAKLADGSALPSWLTFNASTRTFSGTPPVSSTGVLAIRVTASDGYTSTNDDFNITLGNNHAPTVVNPIAAQAAPEDSLFTFVVPANTFTDSDGDTLTYTATLSSGAALPSWLTFNAATRTFSGTPDQPQVGTITVRVSVSDGHGGTTFTDFNLTTANTNDAPVLAVQIPNASVSEAAAFSYTVPATTFTDQDGDTLTYSATLSNGAALPSWLSFNPNTRQFSGTPAHGDVGAIIVRVIVSDGNGGTKFDDFTLTVNNINHAPTVANPIVAQTAPEDSPFSFQVPATTFTDSDGDTLTYSATLSSGAALPSWLSFNAATRTFSGTPDQPNIGTITVRVTANDGHGGTQFNDFTVTTANVNDAPVVANQIANAGATEDTPFSFTVPANAFSDQDGDTLTYSAALSNGAALPAWLSFNPATHQFTGTPAAGDLGAVIVRVTVDDGHGGTAFDDFTLTISHQNHAPTVVNPIGAQSAPEDSPFSFVMPAAAFTDIDGDTLTYSATLSSGAALPAWLSFNAATRTFSGTPDQPNIGSITVRVTANDGHGGTAFNDFNIVTANVNDAPVISVQIPNAAASAGAAFSYTVPATTFSDQDGDALTYSATLSNGSSLPTWLSFNPTTRLLSGTPGAGDAGAVIVRIAVDDGHGGTTFDDFTLTTSVAPLNHAPTVANAIATQAATEGAGFSFAFAANTFADSDGDTLTYTAALASGATLPPGLTFNAATRTFSGTMTAGAMGANTVRVTANDGHGGTVFADFTLNVAAQTVNGTTAANTIAASTTLDQQINALAGDDTINITASAAHIVLNGGDGNDADTVNYTGPAAGTTYNFAVNSGAVVMDTSATNGVELTLTNAEFLTITAGAGNDTFNVAAATNLFDGGLWLLTASLGNGTNSFVGGDEDDWVTGGTGTDTFFGAAGDNQFNGGAGTDTADYSSVIANMTVTSSGATTSATHDGYGTDTLTNVEIIKLGNGTNTATGSTVLTTIIGGNGIDTITGGTGADTLTGNGGNDILNGGAGIDRLTGGAGADRLTGGAAADTFVFTAITDTPVGGGDTITDFVSGTDKIDLSAIDADTGIAADQAFALVASHVGAAEIIVTGSGTSWLVTGYVDGDATADFVINVTGTRPLVGDFLL